MEHLSPSEVRMIQRAQTSTAAAGIAAPQSKDLNLAQLGGLAFRSQLHP